MENRDLALTLFNQKMDKLVENILVSNAGTPELKAEYVRLVNICRRVGVYDLDLAQEVFSAAMLLGYQFAWMVIEEYKR